MCSSSGSNQEKDWIKRRLRETKRERVVVDMQGGSFVNVVAFKKAG